VDGIDLLEFSMEPASARSYLAQDHQFKKTVLDEMDEYVGLKMATRRYIESISNVQDSARSMIAKSVANARHLIEDARRRYAEVSNGDLVGLCACKWDDGKESAAVALLLEWDDIRKTLQARNRKLVNLSRRYVSGAIRVDDK